MPAFMDMIADSGMIRGMLPLLNRCGQSVAPLLLADRIAGARFKSRALRRSTISMSLPFFVLAGSIWLYRSAIPSWFPAVYLLAYAVFFCLHGVNETSYSTVQGKLIPVVWRGRLAAVSNTIGSLVAVCLAWWLLGTWLQVGGPEAFAKIFLFVGSVMFSASLATLLLQERADAAPGPRIRRRQHFREASGRIRQDAVLRGLCLIAGMFVFSQLLFPHYQRLGLELPGAEPVLLMDWVIAQHLGAAAFSNIAGQMADRLGTRAALRLLTAAAACAPLLALGLAWWAPLKWYCLAFFWIGVIPVTLRMQVNYLLEIVARSEHPSYISTMGLCMALPFLLSPLIGAMVQWFGFTPPFLFVAGIVSVAAFRTWTMPEPRHFGSPPAEPAPDPDLTPR